MNTTDNFTSTCFEHPVNKRNAITSGKTPRKLAKIKARKKKKEDKCNEIANRNNKNENRDNQNKTNIYIKRIFIFFETEWLKNWMIIYWLKIKHLLKCVHLRGRKSVVLRTMWSQLYEIYCSACKNKRLKNWKYSQWDCKSYNRSSDIVWKMMSGIVPRLGLLPNEA